MKLIYSKKWKEAQGEALAPQGDRGGLVPANDTNMPAPTDAQNQRQKLGLPHTGSQPAMVYIATHEGVYDDPAQFAASFNKPIEQTQKTFVPLADFVGMNAQYVKNYIQEHPNEIINVIILPAMNENGETQEGSRTFAIDRTNVDRIMSQVKQLSQQQGLIASDNKNVIFSGKYIV